LNVSCQFLSDTRQLRVVSPHGKSVQSKITVMIEPDVPLFGEPNGTDPHYRGPFPAFRWWWHLGLSSLAAMTGYRA
jgi:hypothetical protein